MRKNNATRRAMKVYHAYNPKYFPLCFLHNVFEGAAPYFNLWMSAEIVTALYEGRESRETYLLVLITLFGNLFLQAARAVLNRNLQTAHEILRNREAAAFYRKTLSLDYDKMENPDVWQLRRKIRENACINNYGVEYMRQNVDQIMSCAVEIVFSMALFLEMFRLILKTSFHWLSLLLFAAIIGFTALTIAFDFRAGKKSAAHWDKVGEMMLRENRYGRGYDCSGMDSRMYRQQQVITRLYEKFNKDHLRVFSEAQREDYVHRVPVSVCSNLSGLCSYLLICFCCTLGAFPVGSIIKYVGYLGRLTGNIGGLFYAVNNIRVNQRFVETYLEYLDVPNDMYQGSLAVEKRSDKKFDVVFRDVSFRYAGSETYALKHVNLSLKVGERLAVVGMNGSGKTTFIKLLCRLYDPTEGEVIMNDFNVRKYDYRQYLDLFSVVFQDYNLLSVPLGNNVSCAASWDADKAERLLEEVGFGGRYAEMPKGLETPLYKNFDEDGVIVSGGEAQKIALARALYKDAPFIILDEPTAALDPIAEAEIYAKFDEIVEDKTAIYISHRLSSCRFCDKIAVFDKGEIVQVGTHQELLADEGGKYYELWNAQAQYYA